MKEKIMVAVLVACLIGLGIASYVLRQAEAKPDQPGSTSAVASTASAKVFPSSPSPSSSSGSATVSPSAKKSLEVPSLEPAPSLMKETVEGLAMEYPPGGKVDPNAVIEARKYIEGRWSMDSGREYPGRDLATLKRLAVGEEKKSLGFDLQAWEKPRKMDLEEYTQSKKKHYREELEYQLGWYTPEGDKARVTFAVKITSKSDGERDHTEVKLGQMVMVKIGESWKVEQFIDHPQSP